MKDKSFLNRLKKRDFILIWIAFHLFILILFLLRMISPNGNFSIDSDFFNITPKNIDSAPISKADEKLTSSTGNNVFILVSNPDFNSAKEIANIVYDKLKNSDNFSSISLYNDVSSYSEITDFLFKYRWNMLDEKSIELIESKDGPQKFAEEAAAKVFNPFTITSLDNLEKDPFMLCENNLTNYLLSLKDSGTAMSIKDGVLASEQNGIWYIMIRGVLSEKGSAMATTHNGVNEIYDICLPMETGDTKFIFSGTPYHSNESSLAASKEITLISVISILAVLIMLIAVFRSPVPIFWSVLSILISSGTAFLATMAVFNKVMILTLVFGTSLIGSSIDYSLHYFTHWAGNPWLKNSSQIRNHLFPGLSMAIISTGICYAILLFAPFQLLKQISLFSLTGLLSAFLTTVSIYPILSLPTGERKLKIPNLYEIKTKSKTKKTINLIFILIISLSAISTLIINKNYVGIENDISRLYKMKGRLMENEVQAAKIIQYSPTGWFIISGETENQVLANEENFRKRLETATGKKSGYMSTTLFIPSIEMQKKSRAACEKLIAIADLQFETLGLDINELDTLQKDFENSKNDFISFENHNIPKFLEDSVSTVYLGKINNKFYSVLMPNFTTDENFFKDLSSEDENVYFISKRSDISNSLDKLTKMVLIFFAIAYIVMFIILKFFYTWKQAIKVISVPILITLATSAVFSLTKTKLEFFSVTGLILVFGLGLDYIIYMIENDKNKNSNGEKLEPFATALSFFTTLISFGALALSSFMPVHLIGLSISIGLATAFICSKCLSDK